MNLTVSSIVGGVNEHNSIVNKCCAHDWIAERAIIASKSLHSRKSFVLGELSFAGMPSRQYCLKVKKLHCWNCRPELVNCGQ